MVKLDIYIELDKGEWRALDLFEDESVNLNMKLKDMADLEKVFSPFTQDFTIPASELNNNALRYYFNTELYRKRGRAFPCKIFVGDSLFKVGRLKVKEGQYDNFSMYNYKCEFTTSVSQIKEVIGEDTVGEVIGDWLNDNVSIEWSEDNVYDVIVNGTIDEELLIPLVSTNRVWTYGTGGDSDISTTDGRINRNELKPAIRLDIIVDRLLEYYGLKVEYNGIKDLIKSNYMWLNGGGDDKEVVNKLNVVTPFITYNPPSDTGVFNIFPDNNGIKIVDTGDFYAPNRGISLGLWFRDMKNSITGETYTGDFRTKATNRVTGEVIFSEGWMNGDDGRANFVLPLMETAGAERFYDFEIITEGDISIDQFDIYASTYGFGVIRNQIASMDNPAIVGFSLFDIKYALLDYKVIDIFTSIFKMYNVRVVEDDLNEKSKWLLPTEFRNSGKTIDYNKYMNVSKYPVKPSTLYKNISFSHDEADYFRNVEYKKLVNKEYGSEVYESTDTDLTESYSITTSFNILNWFSVADITLKTSYGFDEPGSPVIPNQPTIMRVEKRDNIIVVEDNSLAEVLYNKNGNSAVINNYVVFGNQSSNGNSITFDIDIEPLTNVPKTRSLYKLYYADDIKRLYYDNSNYYTYEGYLTAPQIINFNMADIVIIEDKQFTIEEASLDLATGKVKLVLLNYIKDIDVVPVGELPYLNRFSAVGGFYKITGNIGINLISNTTGYEIQYTKQDTVQPWQGITIPYTGQESQPYTISGVLSTGLYRVRGRAINDTEVGQWTTIYDVKVSGRAFRIDFEETPDPCSGFLSEFPSFRKDRLYTRIRKWDYLKVGTELFVDPEMTIPYDLGNIHGRFSTLDKRKYFTGVILDNVIVSKIDCPPVVKQISYTPQQTPCGGWSSAVKEIGYVSGVFKRGTNIYSDLALTKLVKFQGNNISILVEMDSEIREVKMINSVVADVGIICGSAPTVNELKHDANSIDDLPQLSLKVAQTRGEVLNSSYYYEGVLAVGTELFEDSNLTIPVMPNPLDAKVVTCLIDNEVKVVSIVEGKVDAIYDESELAGTQSLRVSVSNPTTVGNGCNISRQDHTLVFCATGDVKGEVIYLNTDRVARLPQGEYKTFTNGVEGTLTVNNNSTADDYKSCVTGGIVTSYRRFENTTNPTPCSLTTTIANGGYVWTNDLTVGGTMYSQPNLSTPFVGNGNKYRIVINEDTYWVTIAANGLILDIITC